MTALTVEHLPLITQAVLARMPDAPTLTPGDVVAYDVNNNDATVALDEDENDAESTAITVSNITGTTLRVDDRVMVGFFPPHGAYIVGIVTSPGWQDYTPVVTTWVMNDGTLTGSYRLRDDTLDLHLTATVGNLSTLGVSPTFSLPPGIDLVLPRTANGVAHLFRLDLNEHYGAFVVASGNTLLVKLPDASGQANLTSTTPFTWGPGDEINLTLAGVEIQPL